MKLRNKKTGEIGWLYCDHISVPKKMTVFSEDKDLAAPHWDYSSLAELTEEWEDVPEEPKGIKSVGNIGSSVHIEVGTKEEAEKVVEKLKAWKRLKDKGFEIEDWTNDIGDNYYKTGDVVLNLNNVRNRDWNPVVQISEIKNELDLLFGVDL